MSKPMSAFDAIKELEKWEPLRKELEGKLQDLNRSEWTKANWKANRELQNDFYVMLRNINRFLDSLLGKLSSVYIEVGEWDIMEGIVHAD